MWKKFILHLMLACGLFTATQAQASRAATSNSYLERGAQWSAQGDWDRALADFDLAVAADPANALAWENRGRARRSKGDLEGALTDLSHALKLNLQRAQTWHQRAVVQYLQQDFDAAIADNSQAIKLDPRFVAAWSDRGLAKQAKGNLDGALSDYTRTLELTLNAETFFNRGTVWQSKREFRKAIADYSQAIKHHPDFADAYARRGLTWLLLGAEAAAQKDFDECLRLNPNLQVSLEQEISKVKAQRATKP